MYSRRTYLQIVSSLGLGLGLSVVAKAEDPPPTPHKKQILFFVPNTALGAIVAATCGDLAKIEIDTALEPATLRVEEKVFDVRGRILLKGQSVVAQHRYLDDARNAPMQGAAIRSLLATLFPPFRDRLYTYHKEWTRPFARQIMRWDQRLAKSPVRDQHYADTYERITLLEWAGAHIDAKSSNPSPKALNNLPLQPAFSTLSDYTAYIEALVTALEQNLNTGML